MAEFKTGNTLTGALACAEEWDDFIGQTLAKEQLDKLIKGARTPDENGSERQLEHILLNAHYGYGKTDLARLIAQRCSEPYHEFFMPSLTEDELIDFLDDDDWCGGVIILDELHKAKDSIQHMLLSALKDGVIHTDYGLDIDTSSTTFIGTTNEPAKILPPLRSRFLVQPHFSDYTDDDMTQIVLGMSRRCNVNISESIATDLARAAAGTPRSAQRLVAAARTLVAGGETLTSTSILRQSGLDPDGLSPMQHTYLTTIRQYGGTTGLNNICNAMCTERAVIEELEPMLVRAGYVELVSRGRQLTAKGVYKITGGPSKGKATNAAARRRSA